MNHDIEIEDEMVVMEPRDVYDKAIIGTDINGKVVYDANKVIEAGVEIFESYESSEEWHNYNTWSSYMGEFTPIFVFNTDG